MHAKSSLAGQKNRNSKMLLHCQETHPWNPEAEVTFGTKQRGVFAVLKALRTYRLWQKFILLGECDQNYFTNLLQYQQNIIMMNHFLM